MEIQVRAESLSFRALGSVISSGVERSAMPFGPSKKSQEISPCALLSRDDGGGFPQWE